ncbi:DNA topoisomerase 2-binding protein [Gracilaria domingensis]|nr:DNA topoisomerase 2-binding protein [Gracilaria domingensis]
MVTSSATNSTSHSKDRLSFTKRQDARPGDMLDAVTLYLTERPLRDNHKHAPLRAKALQLANLGGASISIELTDMVNYNVVVHIPIAPPDIPHIREAQERGTMAAMLEWIEDCILQQKLLDTAKYHVPQLAEVTMPEPSQPSSQAQIVTSSTFLGLRVAVGPLAVRDASTAYTVCSQLSSGRAKILAHDAAGYVTSGSPTHVLCGHNMTSTELEVIKDAQSRNSRVLKVTQFWVDMCVKVEGLLLVSDFVVQKVSLSISGFQNSRERDWNRRQEATNEQRVGLEIARKCSRRGNGVVGAEGYALGMEGTPTCSPASKTGAAAELSQSKGNRTAELRDAEAINLFQKLTEKFDREAAETDDERPGDGMVDNIRFSGRSRSTSRERMEDERSWSMDASKNQVIVHRGLTLPPSPTQRVKRARQTM